MNLFRLQNNTPPIYTDESRDFQLFCRLYDCINAGMKFDVDQITGILNAFTCRNTLLPLLQTKLGFFTNMTVEDVTLRYILDAFPDLLKKKGSLQGIQQAINVFLKTYGVRTDVVVWKYQEGGEHSYNIKADEHTIIISINNSFKNTKVLEELFRYIFPVGFQFQFFFYNEASQVIELLQSDYVDLLYVSDIRGAMLRRKELLGTDGAESSDTEKVAGRLVGGVDTTTIASSDSKLGIEEE